MKKYLLLLCLIPFLFAGSIQQQHKAVIAKKGGGTVIFYYDGTSAGAGGAGDGYVEYGYAAWDTTHDSATSSYLDNAEVGFTCGTRSNSTPAYKIIRGALSFDTSALPDGATITEAKLGFLVTEKYDQDNDAEAYVCIVQSNQADLTSLASGDYDGLPSAADSVPELVDNCSTVGDITNLSLVSFTEFTLNATGIALINKTGRTGFAIREGHDLTNTPLGGASLSSMVDISSSESASDPYLQITYN